MVPPRRPMSHLAKTPAAPVSLADSCWPLSGALSGDFGSRTDIRRERERDPGPPGHLVRGVRRSKEAVREYDGERGIGGRERAHDRDRARDDRLEVHNP